MGKGETLKNGVVGALFGLVFHFIPFVGSMFAPVAGGWLAGHLQKEDVGGGLKAGLAAGIIGLIPAVVVLTGVFFLFAFVGLLSADVGSFLGMTLFGGIVSGSILIGFGAYYLILSAVGGVIGGAIAGTGE